MVRPFGWYGLQYPSASQPSRSNEARARRSFAQLGFEIVARGVGPSDPLSLSGMFHLSLLDLDPL